MVAVTFTGSVCPSGVYVISIDLTSTSIGGVIVTVPSLFAATSGAAGAVLSLVLFFTTVFLAGIVAAGLPSVVG